MRFRLVSSFFALAGLALVPTTANAGLLTVRLTQTTGDGGNLTVTDRIGAVGDPNDLSGMENRVVIEGSVGDFTVNSDLTGTSNNPGTSLNGNITTRTLQIRNDSDGDQTLTIELSQTGFVNPGGPTTPMMVTSSFSGSYVNATVGDSVSFVGAGDPGNGLFSFVAATTLQTGMATVASPSTTSFSISPIDPTTGFTRAGSYSLSSIITITLSAGAQVNLEGQVTAIAIPEPGTLAMTFMALPLLGLGYRMRRRSRA